MIILILQLQIGNGIGSSTEGIGIIRLNSGTIENLKFKNIKVQGGYQANIGMIGSNAGYNIKDVVLEDITVKGERYVGGLAGTTSSGTFKNIVGERIKIVPYSTSKGYGSYMGGIFGSVSVSEIHEISDLTVKNSNMNTSGSYIGAVIGYGAGQYFTSEGNEVSGASYVGGVLGYQYPKSEYSNQYKYGSYLYSIDNKITGTSDNIGGVIGGNGSYIRYSYAKDCEIEGVNSVGGIAGLAESINGCEVIDSTITSSGNGVGGLVGYTNAATSAITYAEYSYVYGGSVTGNSDVGGLVGVSSVTRLIMRSCYTNTTVTANIQNAGGLCGRLADKVTSDNRWISSNYVAGSTITSPKNAGGVAGCIENSNITYIGTTNENYIHAYMVCPEATVSLGIGSHKELNSSMARTYVYKYSTINGNYIGNSDPAFPDGPLTKPGSKPVEEIGRQLVRADLEKSNAFISSSNINGANSYSLLGWDSYYYTVSSKNHPKIVTGYAKAKDPVTGAYLQPDIPLPTDPIVGTMMMLMSPMGVELPTMDVYPVLANEVNLEFSEANGNVFMTYKTGDVVSEPMIIDKRVYTFKYDYKTPIEITITNGFKEASKVISPEDLTRKIARVGGNNYFIQSKTLYSNGNEVGEGYIHTYGGKVLNTDGYVYDIATMGQVDAGQTVGVELLAESKPLYESVYEGKTIKTYAKYSEVSSEEGKIERAQQLFVKNGVLSAVDGTLKKMIDGIIIDNHNGNEYQTVLTSTTNRLLDIKTSINCPADFTNSGIIQMTNNINTDDNVVLLLYDTGRVYGFNFITGEEVYDNAIKEDISLFSYIKRALTSIDFTSSSMEEDYQESKKLEGKLMQTPIEEALLVEPQEDGTEGGAIAELIENITNIGNTVVTNVTSSEGKSKNNSYVTVYDTEKGKYLIYKKSELLKTSKVEIVSEDEKIADNPQLGAFYFTEANKDKGIENYGVIWVSITLTAVVIGLAILYKKKK